MKFFALAICCLAVVNATDFSAELNEKWVDFKQKYSKKYETTEHEFRLKIFAQNLRKIRNHNKEFEAGKSTYKMGVNKFTDMLYSEFAERFLMKPRKVQFSTSFTETVSNKDLPASFDWKASGAVTDVKNQGPCGSCWAFSVTGTIEGMNFIKNGELVSLSEQNLLDCSWYLGNNGCEGGEEYAALDYVKSNGGIDTEESYPYKAQDSDTCNYKEENSGASITGYIKVKQGDEEELKKAVATAGPISIAIDAEDSFMHYESGVYYGEDCNSDFSNHAILIVGYDTDEESGQDYWIVKNSWGDGWGENGYIKMSRNANNNCGIANDCYYPTM